MKFSAFVLSALTAQSVAWAASLQASTCGNPADAVALLRGFQHSSEMENAVLNLGYNSEGITGNIFTTQQSATTPFFRLFSPGVSDHFYTTSTAERDRAAAEDGYNEEGTAGFVYTDANCGGSPLCRLYNVNTADHFYTISVAERESAAASGYVFERIAAYIYPA
ncbi:hypothetical protein C8J56DRAFT_1008102 [Mycena floridula]|nr:hypothetical protein C8J56DRAFT_1008102 [Mycena floridula]